MYVDPSARSDDSCCPIFITDDRSSKVPSHSSFPTVLPFNNLQFVHLGSGHHHGAPVELCWWLDEAGVQFRIAGRALIATARSQDAALRSAAMEVWERLAAPTKMQMFWPHPGAVRGAAAEDAAAAADGGLSIDASHFALVIVVLPHSFSVTTAFLF
jgi:hypothetical protein